MDGWRGALEIYFHIILDIFFWKNIFKIKLKYLLRSSKSVVRLIIVKLREREGQRVDIGRSLKGHL